MKQKHSLQNSISTNLSYGFTQDLRQSIEMLELSSIQLEMLIQQELENNPLLEISPPENESFDNDFEELDADNEILKDSLADREDFSSSKISDPQLNTRNDLYNNYVRPVNNFKEFLRNQLSEEVLKTEYNNICNFLIDILDDNGYLPEDYQDQLESIKLYKKEHLAKCLDILQEFEPRGVFARNLAECIKLQLKDHLDLVLIKILENLDLLYKDYKKLLKLCDINQESFSKYLTLIQSTNPKPAKEFNSNVDFAIPDLQLIRSGDNLYVIKNKMANSRVFFSQYHIDRINKNTISEKDKDYIQNALKNSKKFLSSLERREEIILKIGKAIINWQKDYFLYGANFFKPLKLEDIANVTNYNLSTISRAIKNKFIQTDKGCLELKFFFSNEINTLFSEETLAKNVVMEKIKSIVAEENEILSDEGLVFKLSEHNINISRRTVTKYRKLLSIESSAVRKKRKIFQGV